MTTGIRIAVIGAGYWGVNLMRALHDTDGIWLKLVSDARPNALHDVKQQYPHVALTTEWQRVLDDEGIDAVVLATPPATHYALARAALNAGKHVWVEKPLALQYQHGHELVELARETQRVLFVDETFLYDPLVQQARAMLAAGVLGKIHHVSLERTGMGRIRRDSNVWWNSAPHDLSLLRYVLNARVTHVLVAGHAFLQPGIEDVVWATLQLHDDISVLIYLNWLFPQKKASFTVVGEHGILAYEGRFTQRSLTRYEYHLERATGTPPKEVELANLIPIEKNDVAEALQGDRTEPLALACAAFRESILTGQPALSSGAASLSTLAVLDAGARSLTQGTPIAPVSIPS